MRTSTFVSWSVSRCCARSGMDRAGFGVGEEDRPIFERTHLAAERSGHSEVADEAGIVAAQSIR